MVAFTSLVLALFTPLVAAQVSGAAVAPSGSTAASAAAAGDGADTSAGASEVAPVSGTAAGTTGGALPGIVPSEPSSDTIVKEGEDIHVSWDKDTSGTWNNFTIQLMTGANLNMVFLQDLAVGVDGVTGSELSIPVPEVSPHSKIYFLQFLKNGINDGAPLWTTRFTIAGADGTTTPPDQSTTTNGETVEWGMGSVVQRTPVMTGGATSGSPTPKGNDAAPVAASTPSQAAAPASQEAVQASNTPTPQPKVSSAPTTTGTGSNSSARSTAGISVAAVAVAALVALTV